MTGTLDTAKGRIGVRSQDLVDGRHARLDIADEPLFLTLVTGPCTRAKPEGNIVCDLNGFVDILDLDARSARLPEYR